MAWATNVAQIGEDQFESLSAAIASLDQNGDGKIDQIGSSSTYGTITLLADVDETVTVDMSLASTSTNRVSLEFDLAGHRWNGNINWPSGSSNYAYLRVKNGTYNGTISISGGSGYLKLDVPGENGLSGSIATTGNVNMSLLLPNSGTFSANLNIGTTTNMSIGGTLKYTGAATFSENATLTMSAATAEFSPSSLTGTPTFKLTGGKTNFDPTNYLATGYYATFADGKYTINVHNVYNNTKAQGYADFISAYAAAGSGDSLTIMKAVTAGDGTGSYLFDKYVRLGGVQILTFNFENVEFNNEYQNFNANFIVPAICTATFTAGTYNAKYYNGILGSIIVNGADVTLSASGPQVKADKTWTLNSGTLAATYSSNMSVAAGGTLTISGGELVLRNYQGIMLAGNSTTPANFNMSNGKIICYTENALYNSSSQKAKLNITGGEIEYRFAQTSTSVKGAALYFQGTVDSESVFENFSIKAYDNTIANTNAYANTIYPYAGGRGIYNSYNNNITLNNVSIDAYDAALYSTKGNWTLNNCTFVSRIGSAIATGQNTTLTITGGTFKSEAPAASNKEVIARTGNSGTFTFTPSGDLSVYTLLAHPTINGLTNIFEEQPEGSHWFVLTGHNPNTIAEVRKNGGNIIEVATMADVLDLFPVSTINTLDITLLRDYKLDLSDPLAVYAGKVCNINLKGHKLTVDGTSRKLYVSGTLNINGETAGSEIKISKGDGIYVENGGVVNVSGGKYTTTSSGRVFENDGTLNLNNAVVDAWYRGIYNSGIANLVNTSVFSDANYAIYTSGTEQKQAKLYIKGLNTDSIRSNSSTKHGSYSYAVRVHNNAYCSVTKGGANNDENINISGVQGGLAVSDNAIADIYGGKFDTRTCAYGGGNYYALYVAVDAIANVYGGKFSTAEDAVAHRPAIFCGNNDITSILGIANVYGGVMSNKAYVQHAPTNTFPASVPNVSQWYSSFGTDVPLPAGYEYYEIIAAGTPEGKQVVDADAYAAGYRWQVVCTNNDTKEVNVTDPTATIPWQQNTTWDPNANPEDTGIVPEETTIVTIPIDATVVVKNDPSMDTLAVAEQIFVNQGATLKVEPGTTLNVGDGGVNIANGGQIVVEPGAIVTVGDAGIITTEDEALVIESSEQQQGVLLLNPEVTENTQPKATVKLVTKAKQIAANDYIYERFAIPTIDGNATVYNVEDAASVVLYPGETELKHGLYEWDGSDWAFMSSFKQMEPFKGYQLTNNSANANVVYTFEGNLVGNHNEDYSFASAGFGFFGNSYTGAIDIKKFMDSFGDEMQKTIWIYDYYTDGFKTITPESYGTVKYGTRRNSHGTITEIRSMQAFLMNRSEAGSTTVNYESAIWANPKYGLVSTPDPTPDLAPAKRVAANEDKVTIYVATDTQEDEVTFIRSNEYSSAFDNGADASKWMNNGMNLYVVNGDENMAIVASDEIVDMTIAFRSGNESEYTLGFDNLAGQEFSIKDVLTGATVLMTEGATYTFSQEANTTVPARFQIIGAKKVPTGVENVSEGANVQQKVVKNGVLYILRDNKWYNAQGQMVK